MRSWFQSCDMNCKPGIHESVLKLLQEKATILKEKGTQLVCSVSFDEMNIRKQIKWSISERKLMGYVTYGWNKNTTSEYEMPPFATQVIVFMVSGLNQNFQIPISYQFIATLNADDKKNLLLDVINAVLDVGVKVSNITFDGCAANKSMCKALGAKLDASSDQFQTYFLVGDQKIYIILDACHMEKLVRSTIGDKKIMFDKDDRKIEWQYFVDLVEFRNKGLALTHKMNQKHLHFQRRRMKVDIATQTLSASVADSMQYLKNEGYAEFENANATIQFTRTFNTLFDIFNTKDGENSNIFKQSLSVNNENTIFDFCDATVDYIKHLKIADKNGRKINILKSLRHTGFLGYLVNINSLKQMFNEYVKDTSIISSIPTYTLSQDFLEIFFGKNRYFIQFYHYYIY